MVNGLYAYERGGAQMRDGQEQDWQMTLSGALVVMPIWALRITNIRLLQRNSPLLLPYQPKDYA